MPEWLKHTRHGALTVSASIALGVAATVVSSLLSLRGVDGRQIDVTRPDLPADIGPLPATNRLHVREGVFWLVAMDVVPGVSWYHIERHNPPSVNPELEVPLIPWWAEAPAELRGRDTPGQAEAIGTLGVGWPYRALAKQWIEQDRLVGFMPKLENDDDGSTTARAATRFFEAAPNARWIFIPGGFAANTAIYTVVALPFVFLLRRRFAKVT